MMGLSADNIIDEENSQEIAPGTPSYNRGRQRTFTVNSKKGKNKNDNNSLIIQNGQDLD